MTNESSGRDEIRQTRPFRGPAQETTVAILRTADVVRRQFGRVLEPTGLTLQQYNVLRILRGSAPDPLPTLEIGHRLIEQTPGITRLLDRLEEKGLVRRQRCDTDRRQVHCWITPAGLTLLDDLDAAVDAADERCCQRLSGGDQLRDLLSALAAIRASYPVT
jgi:DNA-binding MarR family transcriptional regulator